MTHYFQKTRRISIALIIVFTSGTAALACASDKRRGPPQAAFSACENASENDRCSFEGRRGETLNGQCGLPPKRDELVCIPEGHKMNKRGKGLEPKNSTPS